MRTAMIYDPSGQRAAGLAKPLLDIGYHIGIMTADRSECVDRHPYMKWLPMTVHECDHGSKSISHGFSDLKSRYGKIDALINSCIDVKSLDLALSIQNLDSNYHVGFIGSAYMDGGTIVNIPTDDEMKPARKGYTDRVAEMTMWLSRALNNRVVCIVPSANATLEDFCNLVHDNTCDGSAVSGIRIDQMIGKNHMHLDQRTVYDYLAMLGNRD